MEKLKLSQEVSQGMMEIISCRGPKTDKEMSYKILEDNLKENRVGLQDGEDLEACMPREVVQV